MSIAVMIASLLLPAAAVAGPEGTYHVKGVNPDSGKDYTGTVKVTRKGGLYRVVWQIGNDQTTGVGLGIRIVDGQMVAGAADDGDTGIAIAYASGTTAGNATYTEFSDGTWRGVWAFQGYKKPSTEEWIPMVRQVAAKSISASKAKIRPVKRRVVTSDVQEAKADNMKTADTPARVMSSPLPASASPKS